jgi:hypothetical protein
VQCNGARSFIIAAGIQNDSERGTVLPNDREDPDPTEHRTVLCATAAVVAQRQMSHLRSLASVCV